MVSLDSPLLSLGALFLAGNSSEGMQFTGGETGRGLVAGGFAAASSDAAVNEVRNALGVEADALSDELAQALLGAGLSRWGGPIPQNKAMARAIHYDVAAQAVEGAGFALGDLLSGNGNGNGNNTQARQVDQQIHRQVTGNGSANTTRY